MSVLILREKMIEQLEENVTRLQLQHTDCSDAAVQTISTLDCSDAAVQTISTLGDEVRREGPLARAHEVRYLHVHLQ